MKIGHSRITEQPDAAPSHRWLWEVYAGQTAQGFPTYLCGVAPTRIEAEAGRERDVIEAVTARVSDRAVRVSS